MINDNCKHLLLFTQYNICDALQAMRHEPWKQCYESHYRGTAFIAR